MNYVGIDISKYKHDCFITTDLGEVVNEGFSFANNTEGFAMLQHELELCGKGNTRIGFEATGNYGINLKLFLERIGYDYMEINPLLIKEYIKSKSLRRTKTDKLDAIAIAGYISVGDYRAHRASFYQQFSLKQLTRLRGSLVSQRSRYLVQLTNVLDCIFPEFKPLFNNKFSVTALYILANYPSPKSIANMNVCSYDILRRKSHGKFTMDKFVKLKELAKNTVGVNTDCYRVELEMLINLYSQLDSRIGELNTQITAVIVSELGDISRFATPDKMLSFAGLEPGFFQSGNTEYKGHMVKHGSAPLRGALMNCAGTVRLYNETFAVYYLKKINEGKPHCVAISHVAKKLVRLIFALETKGIAFDPARLR